MSGVPMPFWKSTISLKHHKLQQKPKTTDEPKVALQTTWEVLPREAGKQGGGELPEFKVLDCLVHT